MLLDVGLAEQPVQGEEQFFHARIGDPVPQRLGFAAERDQVLVAHLGEVLRQGGLRQSDRFGERADAGFAPLDQLAQDHQPPLVGERAQDVGDLGGLALERNRIQLSGVGHSIVPQRSILVQ